MRRQLKNEKKKKHVKFSVISEGFFWFHTQNPQRFPQFAVVVVFFEILDDFHGFIRICVFPEDNQQPILGGHRFPHEKYKFYWTSTRNTNCTRENQRFIGLLRSAPLTIFFLNFEPYTRRVPRGGEESDASVLT